MFEIFYLIVIIACLLAELWRQRRGYKVLEEEEGETKTLPPGSMGIPVIGETIHFIIQKADFFRQKRQKYGPIFKTHLLGKPTIRVSGKENVRRIILGENKIVQSSYPPSVQKLLGSKSITISCGEQHKNKKRQLMKFLSPDFLAQHVDAFSEISVEYLKKWSDCPSVEIYKECRLLFTDLAARYLVSMDIAAEDNLRMKELFQIFSDNLFTFPVNLPGFGFHKALRAKAELKKMFKKIVEQSGKSSNEFSSVLEAYGASMNDFSEFNEESFLDAITELLWNASETLSSTAVCVIYLLAKNPRVLRKLCSELQEKEFMSTNSTQDASGCYGNRPITAKNVLDLHYLDCVVKEVLRTVPTIGGAYRKVIESFTLEGYTIPKDWRVVIGIRDTHENDISILDPLEFNPDRWTEAGSTSSIAFLPFGGGARVCPGKNFAKLVLKIFTVELCRRCDWKLLTDNPELTLFPTPRPKGNWKVCFFSKFH
ncbi:hypothetical protein FSP39_017375 [Pinctada imbricata]|uniref:Uncharacterized protein n=1 Tax=Pinctada imbricata TaxID=66713 RepID=A0AA88Y0M1_PINIB|nr:hypothetical protein FSP39_017375 [Pinctada imbricata]